MKFIKSRFFPIAILLILFIAGIYFAYTNTFSGQLERSETPETGVLPGASKANVEAYFRDNISMLSPELEVLGGKFYVTKIEFLSSTRALVEYEDGHNAFKAEAEFFFDQSNLVKILNFKVLQRN